MDRRLIILLPVILIVSIFPSQIIPNGHAGGYTGTGLVCITYPPTGTNCPSSAASIGPVSVGSTFSVGVFINNSLPMGGFDIYVAVNRSYLNPTSAVLGPLIASPTQTNICINGVSVAGSCTGLTANGPGIVEVSTIESSGSNECGNTHPCAGLAFNVTYQVVGSTGSTPIFYPVDGTGCSTSSVSSPANVCVLVDDSLGTTLPENIQGATVTQAVSVNPTNISVSCSSPVVVGGATKCTTTVTDTGSSGQTNPTGQVTFSTSASGAFSPSACTLSAVGTNQATCFTNYAPSAVGSGTHSIVSSYPGDTVHTGSTSGAFALSVSPSSLSLSIAIIIDATGQPVNATRGVPTGTSVHSAALLIGGYPVTGVTGTVTYSEFANGNCAGSGTYVSKVNIGPNNNVPNSESLILASPGSYGFIAIYAGDASNAPAGSGCQLAVVGTTTTTVTCSTSPVAVGLPTSCSVTVRDTSTSPTTPIGTVGFATNSTGTFSPTSSCTLAAGLGGTASCSITYAGTITGHHQLTVSYPGDTSHTASGNTYNLAVILRSTTLTVSCTANTDLVAVASSCTATVTDASSSPTSPTGIANFSTNGTGVFGSSGSCALAAGVGGTASCSVAYTPSNAGHQMITGSYSADSTHAASANTFSLTAILRTITASITCSPTSQTVGISTTCTVTVNDTSSSPTSATGTVGFSTDSSGGFTSSSCTLTPVRTGVSSCSVTYTPNGVGNGSHKITATYSGDSSHSTSNGTSPLTVNAVPTSPNVQLSQLEFYSMIGAIVALAGLLAYLARGRGKQASMKATTSTSAPIPAPQA